MASTPFETGRLVAEATPGDNALAPYANWIDFQFSSKHPESMVNFVAAFGTHPTILSATTVVDKRAAADAIVNGAGAAPPADRFDFLFSTGPVWSNTASGVTRTGVDNIDLWIGGLAERIAPFGGMLGSTFNFIFETQLENLQNADRFYYLERLDGLNLLSQLEANSFADRKPLCRARKRDPCILVFAAVQGELDPCDRVAAHPNAGEPGGYDARVVDDERIARRQ